MRWIVSGVDLYVLNTRISKQIEYMFVHVTGYAATLEIGVNRVVADFRGSRGIVSMTRDKSYDPFIILSNADNRFR